MLHWLTDRDVIFVLMICVTAIAVGSIALTAVLLHLLQ